MYKHIAIFDILSRHQVYHLTAVRTAQRGGGLLSPAFSINQEDNLTETRLGNVKTSLCAGEKQ